MATKQVRRTALPTTPIARSEMLSMKLMMADGVREGDTRSDRETDENIERGRQ